MIEFDRVSVAFEGTIALDDVSVKLDQKRIGVIGLNGSGKSTFARLLNGLVKPTSGSVFVGGVNPAEDAKAARAQTGFIFSNPDVQIIMPTVLEDVAFSLRGSGLKKAEIDAKSRAILSRFEIEHLADQAAHSLSSGQKQLLAICAILVTEPKLIVADEPTALLDLVNSRRIARALLSDLPQQIVLVTHDLELAAGCDILVRFAGAKIVQIGEPSTVISSYLAENA
ncbi:MAG: ATP-binding cassette domain-containing protein [Actinobacteria bacterium]|nr:ATP-binding cassette domain-containing protein [Actinomycetota bacterium]